MRIFDRSDFLVEERRLAPQKSAGNDEQIFDIYYHKEDGESVKLEQSFPTVDAAEKHISLTVSIGNAMLKHLNWDEAAQADRIENFINRFKDVSLTKNVIEVFTCGCCYWFAHILCSEFKEGKIMYDPVVGHFVAEIGDRLYDITGDVTGQYEVIDWDSYNDGLDKGRVRDYCIDFTKK